MTKDSAEEAISQWYEEFCHKENELADKDKIIYVLMAQSEMRRDAFIEALKPHVEAMMEVLQPQTTEKLPTGGTSVKAMKLAIVADILSLSKKMPNSPISADVSSFLQKYAKGQIVGPR